MMDEAKADHFELPRRFLQSEKVF